MKILRLNKSGLPISWLSKNEAATLYVKQQVLWSLGEKSFNLKGGVNENGLRSELTLATIIACDGNYKKKSFTPALSNSLLFRRDEFHCMYCGEIFSDRELTRDHIKPRVQGGADVWTNVVAACQRCNGYKGGRTPEQAGMQLLAIPFEPNIFEFMYLANRNILGDQMGYLSARFTGQRSWAAA
ncbi:HNH endonuclease [Endozoicomonas sp. SM1973]|uniref:HNH endonuclease n=1 Tax=Spartinivicinus marinus TaxID=2994442 RepID=A0A853ICV9_9GAMM|nr:HNH endonuclease [Spartinivicinus marinus]MCX4027029.1 HNH endonuclease [Spartinivicinus marinus]NYZ67025.1 HNH endonuclease [Spartinivicinus marinus]